ncbi:DUF1129 domain-containing protein [Lentilactobacillus hilgardii]|uniref:DUF1129 domain-containing protein n=1 Tax=Lentilactobacillus hilgardii TaxID=1588 RepID=UPI003FA5E66A
MRVSSSEETKQERNARKRNANVQQDRDRAKKIVHSQFDNIGLTKRNAEYMFRFNQEIAKTKLTPQQQADTIHQMVEELLAGQKSGKTARNMWGTVDQRIQRVLNPPKRKPDIKRDYWPNAFYNMLLFFVIFTFMYGITFFFTKSSARGMMGITGIVLSSIIAGLGIPALTMLIQPGVKHKYPLWLRIIFMVLFFVVWMGVFFFAGLIPAVINPVLNPYVYIALGAVGVVGAFFVKRNFQITGGLF